MSAALDRLAQLARNDAPAPLAEAETRCLVDAAVAAAAGRRASVRRARQLRTLTFVAAVAGAAAAALVLVWMRPVEHAQVSAVPLHFELPSGDRVTATPGARLEVQSAAAHERRLALEGGTALFDVAPLGGGSRFEVTTPHARVEVRGTVFSVTSTHEHTVVRVYEGHVRVTLAGHAVELYAGQTWASDGPTSEADPLRDSATRAAAARSPHVTALPMPNVEPLAERAAPAAATAAEPAAEPAAAAAAVPAAATAAATAAAAEPVRAPDSAALAEARSWITLGTPAAERARRIAHERADSPASERPGAWRLVEADALRALGRHAEAAAAYDAAARLLPADEAAHAGYLAAWLHLEREDDPEAALASLDAALADAPGATLEERSLALRAGALARDGRTDEAAATAARYLARFPDGGQAAAMRALRR
jgi:hypothetical protein